MPLKLDLHFPHRINPIGPKLSTDGPLTLPGWLFNQRDLAGVAWRTKSCLFRRTVRDSALCVKHKISTRCCGISVSPRMIMVDSMICFKARLPDLPILGLGQAMLLIIHHKRSNNRRFQALYGRF